MTIFFYLIKEIMPQLIANLVIFSTIIVISQLMRVAEMFLAFGLTAENIFLPFLYTLVPFLPLIIPMAANFGTMLAFARLSADGELASLLAAGLSLKKLYRPVLTISVVFALLSGYAAVSLESWGRREFLSFVYRKTQTELDGMLKNRLEAQTFFNGFLDYILYADKISGKQKHMENVFLAPQISGESQVVLTAPRASITGSVAGGDLAMDFSQGQILSIKGDKIYISQFQEANIDLIRIFEDKILGPEFSANDYRALPLPDLNTYLQNFPDKTTHAYRKALFLKHYRFGLPLLVFALMLLGMLSGIVNQRQTKSAMYWYSILLILGSYCIVVLARWAGEQGHLPIYLAAYGPEVLLMGLGLFMLKKRDSLPLSESLWSRTPKPS